MQQPYCAQCGGEVDGEGIRHRGRLFCSDECCEEFEEDFLTRGEPGVEELDGDDDDDFDEDDLDIDEDDDDGDFVDDDIDSDDDRY